MFGNRYDFKGKRVFVTGVFRGIGAACALSMAREIVHPFATGRLARWRVVRRFLLCIRKHKNVWLAPMEDIAACVNRVIAWDDLQPRIDEIPYYHSAVIPTRDRRVSHSMSIQPNH